MKSSTKLLKLVTSINEAKAAEAEAKKKVKAAEEAIIKMMGEIVTTTLEKNGVIYTITLGENCRYALTEEGKRRLMNEVPYESDLWDKKPSVQACMNDKDMKAFIIRKDYEPKVLITKKESDKK